MSTAFALMYANMDQQKSLSLSQHHTGVVEETTAFYSHVNLRLDGIIPILLLEIPKKYMAIVGTPTRSFNTFNKEEKKKRERFL